MPKDVRRSAATPPPNAPVLKDHIPQRIFDRLERRRAAGNPVKWTDRKVKAVIKHVSTLPTPPPSVPSVNWTAVREAREAAQRTTDRFRAQRQHEANEARAAVAASSSKLSLAERLSAAPTYEPIARKPIGIDIPRYSPTDLIGIFTPKFDATIKRLAALEEVDLFDTVNADHAHHVGQLLERLREIRHELARLAATTTFEEWHRYELGLAQIGDVSFAGLRCNFRRIVAGLDIVYCAGYFD